MTFVRNTIDDAYIDVEGTIIPIASFRVSFSMGMLPSAEIIPALGRELTTGLIATIESIQEDQEAKLYFVFNGETKLLLSGFIQKMSASDNATMFNRRVSARLRIIHRAVKLAGAPGMSYAYTSDNKASLASLSKQRSRINPVTGEDYKGFNQPFFEFGKAGAGGSRAPATAIQYPSTFLKKVTEAVVENNGEAALPDDLIREYDPANLSNIQALDFTNVLRIVFYKYSQAWGTRNTLEALLATCHMMFLELVFYNEGFYIANPNSLINTPTVNIVSDDYLSISHTKLFRQEEDVDGVVLRHPFAKLPNDNRPGVLVVYPPVKDTNVTGEGVPEENKYYHFADVPAWLRNAAKSQWADRVAVVNRGIRKGLAEKNKRDEPLPAYYNRVGTRIARAIYAKMKEEKAGVTLTLPYREDLMPGTVVSIENADTLDVKFMGNTIFGMIHTLNIECDVMADSPNLQCTVDVVSARSELDNQETPAGYGLSENPIYQGNWVGCNLFGDLLADEPAHTPRPSVTTQSNNANAGGGVGR